MRIVHIAAGAGAMYCGACARDMNLFRGLLALGHDVQVLPLYTPLRDDAALAPAGGPLFLGGINAYLQQLSPLFAHLPRWLGRALDRPELLSWVAKFAIQTNPTRLGPMTLSVLQGRDGKQRAELDRLLEYLRDDAKPQILSITNSLLSGVAPSVKEAMEIPIVCSLQGEDSFIDGLSGGYRHRVIEQIRANASAIDLFLSTSAAQADVMASLLDIPRDRIAVTRAGIDAASYTSTLPRPREPFTIGYLSVITPAKGLDLLVDAVARLQRDSSFPMRLRIAGRVLHPRYWRTLNETITRAGLRDAVDYLDEVDLLDKITFLQQCSVLVCPTRIAEARGMVALEAQAAGVPVIVPNTGIFPEMLARTGGGLLVPAENPAALATALQHLADDPELADTLGKRGASGVQEHYNQRVCAEQVEREFARLLALTPEESRTAQVEVGETGG